MEASKPSPVVPEEEKEGEKRDKVEEKDGEKRDKVEEKDGEKRDKVEEKEGEKRDKVEEKDEGVEVVEEVNSPCSTYCESCEETEIEEIINSMSQDNNKYDWTSLAIRGGITTILYPSQMSQILMQIGYEPFPPRPSVTLLGRPCLLLPSTGTYLKYIYHVDGVRGVFRGLGPRLTQQLLFTYVFDSTRRYLRRRQINSLVAQARTREETVEISIVGDDARRPVDDSELSESGSAGFVDHFRDVLQDLGSKVAAIVVSYPVHVVVVRTIAQFVGREHCIRQGVLGEISAIYKDFGILGFYRGIVPKILGETCQTLMVGALAYFVSNQAPGIEVKSLLNLSFSILVSAWTYQFSVVSTTMAVNGSWLVVPLSSHLTKIGYSAGVSYPSRTYSTGEAALSVATTPVQQDLSMVSKSLPI